MPLRVRIAKGIFRFLLHESAFKPLPCRKKWHDICYSSLYIIKSCLSTLVIGLCHSVISPSSVISAPFQEEIEYTWAYTLPMMAFFLHENALFWFYVERFYSFLFRFPHVYGNRAYLFCRLYDYANDVTSVVLQLFTAVRGYSHLFTARFHIRMNQTYVAHFFTF